MTTSLTTFMYGAIHVPVAGNCRVVAGVRIVTTLTGGRGGLKTTAPALYLDRELIEVGA